MLNNVFVQVIKLHPPNATIKRLPFSLVVVRTHYNGKQTEPAEVNPAERVQLIFQ